MCVLSLFAILDKTKIDPPFSEQRSCSCSFSKPKYSKYYSHIVKATMKKHRNSDMEQINYSALFVLCTIPIRSNLVPLLHAPATATSRRMHRLKNKMPNFTIAKRKIHLVIILAIDNCIENFSIVSSPKLHRVSNICIITYYVIRVLFHYAK